VGGPLNDIAVDPGHHLLLRARQQQEAETDQTDREEDDIPKDQAGAESLHQPSTRSV
jgi:hypothetical protein